MQLKFLITVRARDRVQLDLNEEANIPRIAWMYFPKHSVLSQIGRLQQKLGEMDGTQRDVITEYEEQVTQLKAEVGRVLEAKLSTQTTAHSFLPPCTEHKTLIINR